MKKLYFFIIGILFVIMISIVFDKMIFDSSDSLNKLKNVYLGKHSTIMIGSSRCLGSFIPSVIDSTNSSFNYGLSGTGNKLWLNILKDLIQDNYSQTIIISVDYNSLDMSNKTSDGDFRFYLKTDRTNFSFKNLNQKTKDKIHKFPWYYFGDLMNLSRIYIREKINFTGFVENGCRIELNKISDELFYKISKSENQKNSFIISDQTRVFLDSFNLISNKKDKIIFVNLPVYSLDKDSNRTFNFLKSKYPNIGSFINLGDVFSDRDYFFDFKHPSLLGAYVISNTLKDSLDCRLP